MVKGKLFFHDRSEVPPLVAGQLDGIGDAKFFLVGALGLKEIFYYPADGAAKGKGPGILKSTPSGKVFISDLNEDDIIVCGVPVTVAELTAIVSSDPPASPCTPVDEEDFEGDFDDA